MLAPGRFDVKGVLATRPIRTGCVARLLARKHSSVSMDSACLNGTDALG